MQIDALNCSGNLLDTAGLIDAMQRGASEASASVRQQLVEPFNLHGATLVLVLAESHFVVSTWPELAYVTIDAALCNEQMDFDLLVNPLLEILNPGRIQQTQKTTEVNLTQ